MGGFTFSLQRGPLTLGVDRRGAVITAFTWAGAEAGAQPLLRTARDYAGDPLAASCFPLLPFGNRVAGNRFNLADECYAFTPNQSWDRHYLHGDGWLSEWQISAATDTQIALSLAHPPGAESPYAYDARISYELTKDLALSVGMELCNRGRTALPFGLGLHPYFPLTPQTTLQAPADGFFTEEADFMPGPRGHLPQDLDFAQSRLLPRRWINNGLTGWPGEARIAWPERRLALRITAEPGFGHYFLFMSDRSFEPAFAGDYFCFEPMTHQADGHHAPDFGGLVLLAPGAAMRRRVLFTPEEITP